MTISSKHPYYSTFLADWSLCRDAYRGERVIKDKGQTYLPPTSGQVADGMNNIEALGRKSYEAYKLRAVFPDHVKLAVETLIGMMWGKPPTIKLPEAMEPMREKITASGEGMNQLLRRINEQQLVVGRLGLLLDIPTLAVTPKDQLPYVAMYSAESIINWDDGAIGEVDFSSLNLVVLDESEFERDQFTWALQNKYRILKLGDLEANEAVAPYSVATVTDEKTMPAEENFTQPNLRGKTLDKIPFTIINSKDIVATPDDPPLLGLARLAIAIYRGEADYRQSLFLQGQDTLVIIGAGGGDDEKTRVGAGAVINLGQGGDAKFIGVKSDGLAEQRQALENDKIQASIKAGQMIDGKSNSRESGDALKTRIAAQTATLNQIALSGAEGLQTNLDFANQEMDGRTLVDIMTAKQLGAPLSNESIHKLLQNKDMTEMTYEDELAEIEDEAPLIIGTDDVTGLDDNPTGSEIPNKGNDQDKD
jgi:hypothetical protein